MNFLPNELKLANVIPVFKKKIDLLNKENYRPVSLLFQISKVFQRTLPKLIDNFMKTKLSMLCGFRETHSS